MNPTLEYVLNRLSEKSTWNSIGTLFTGLGVGISPEHWQAIMVIGMGIGGLAGILLPARVMEKNVSPAPPREETPLSKALDKKL